MMNPFVKKHLIFTAVFLFSARSIIGVEEAGKTEPVPKWVQKMDANKDAYVSKEEWLSNRKANASKEGRPFDEKKLSRIFSQMDLDGDEKISFAEFSTYISKKKSK